MMCKPKDQGGLGILNLRVQNQALVMKNLHKFYNHVDIPWVKLIWHAYYDIEALPNPSAQKPIFGGEIV
jgi:hypothetical protein